jgi:hypothetical protein
MVPNLERCPSQEPSSTHPLVIQLSLKGIPSMFLNRVPMERIKDHVIHNQITIANELNNYFLNIAGSVSNKRINEKGEEASPLQNLFNPLPALMYQNVLDLNVACQAKHTDTYVNLNAH